MRTIIRPEQPGDHAAIDEVNRLAFEGETEARLVAAIRTADGFDPSLSLVAVRDGQLVGHIMFSAIHVETDQANVPAAALAPMAVVPVHQRRGIGSELVREGLEACRRAGHRIAVVVGHADYYPRFGFIPAGRHGLRPPFPVPDEAFMALALTSCSLNGIRGVVRYPAAFDES